TAVAAPSGQLGYEVQVSNPANGLNFFDLGTAFSLEVEVDHPGSRLIAEQVEVSSSYACGEVVSHEDGLSIPGLILLPGEQLFVFVPVEKSRNLSPDNIKVEASVFAGEVLLGLGKPVLGQEYPVSWEGFDGEVRENRALLSWKVNKEKGNKGFVIEYSPNGKSFTDITLVPGSEDHTDLLTYQFESEPLTVGRHMFRLRQVGFDGSSSHTRQVELFIGCERPASINLSSIDPRQGGYASIMVQKGQQAKISLADHQGRTLKVLYEGFMNPLLSYEIFVDQQKMLPGEYQIVMEGNTDKIFREFTVERS
ncbi:MAG: hypothetical protein NWR72_05115, partial [Bacteroidia bacterium]|nr:hypothetical protein [Bacteroidia bacterium]